MSRDTCPVFGAKWSELFSKGELLQSRRRSWKPLTIGKIRPSRPERLAHHWANQDKSRQNSRLRAGPVCNSSYGISGVFVEKDQSLAAVQKGMAEMLVATRGSELDHSTVGVACGLEQVL